MFSAKRGGLLEQGQWIVTACAFLLLTSGCVTNHPFVSGERLDVPELVTELETKDKDEKALVDLTYFPFAYLDLKLFTETEDTEHYPEGHTFVSVQSWLPLSLIVDAEIELFDVEQAGYETHEFTSVLWGLWSRHHQTIPTDHGERIERNYGLLWIFDFGPSIHYDQPTDRSL